MKRLALVGLVLLILCGCSANQACMDRAMALRARMLNGNGCEFTAVITADYGSTVYTFTLECAADRQGKVNFVVTEPQSIAGVSGTIGAEGGKLTFDALALAFPLLADGQLSPVSSPWILVKTLRGGYLTSCGVQGDSLLLSIDDSYEDDALHLDIRLNGDDLPESADILWGERRILSMQVKNFRIL